MIDTKALRTKILDLAFDGKLSSTFIDDEPVYKLVSRLKTKPIENELSNYPSTWTVIPFSSFADIYTGNSTSDEEKKKYSKFVENSIEYISTKDISILGKVNYENGMYIPNKGEGFKVAKAGSILLCIEGANAGNKIAIINRDVCFVNKLCCFTTNEINNKFIYYYLQSSKFRNRFMDKLQGIIGGVSISKVKSLPVPIPPTQEQKRLVEIIDSLFSWIEKIESSQNDIDIYKKLATDKILEYALSGKLTIAKNDDSNIKETFKQILEKKKTYKAQKNDDKIFSDSDIKSTWIKTKFSNVINLVSGNDLTPNLYSSSIDEIVYITGASNIENGQLIVNRYTKKQYVNSHLEDILFSCKGTIGKIAINNIGDIHVARQIMAIKPFINANYVILYLESIVSYLKKHAKSQIPGIDRDQILDTIIELPPVEEQQRIVDKVNEYNDLLKLL